MLSAKRRGTARGRRTRQTEMRMKKRRRKETRMLFSRLRRLCNPQHPRRSCLECQRASILTAKSRYTGPSQQPHRLEAGQRIHWIRSLLRLMLSMLDSTRLANSVQGYRLTIKALMQELSTQLWKLTTSLRRPDGPLRTEPMWRRSWKQPVHPLPRREVSMRRGKKYSRAAIPSCIFLSRVTRR